MIFFYTLYYNITLVINILAEFNFIGHKNNSVFVYNKTKHKNMQQIVLSGIIYLLKKLGFVWLLMFQARSGINELKSKVAFNQVD